MIKRIVSICVLVITVVSLLSCDNLEQDETESLYHEPTYYDVILNCPEDEAVNGTVVSVEWNKRYVLPFPARENYSFEGWEFDGSLHNSIGIWPYASGAELVAVWKPIEYTITYRLSPHYNDAVGTYHIETEKFVLPVPKKVSEYMFAGWTGNGIKQPTKVVEIPTGSYGNLEYTANWIKSADIDNKANGFVMEIVDNKAVVVGYCGEYVETATIPTEYKGYPVTTIGKAAFFGLGKFVDNLIIPYAVLNIEDYAFEGCSGTGLQIFISGGEFEDWKNSVSVGENNGTLGKW